MSRIADVLSSQQKQFDRLADQALEIAKSRGADAAKIGVSASYQQKMVVENKEFSLANSIDNRSISIVIHKDKKQGSASINTTDENAVTKAVDDALQLAKYSVPDEALTLAQADEAPAAVPLEFLFDDSMSEIGLDRIQGYMEDTLRVLTADSRIALDRYEFAVNHSSHSLYNSHGVRQSERQSMANWFFFGMAIEGEQVTGFDYDGSFAFAAKDIESRSRRDAEKFVQNIIANLSPRKCPSYKGAVILSPRAVHEILVDMIVYHASGNQIMDNRSKWDKSVGEQVMSADFSLSDLPHAPEFSGASAYDGDGVPTRDLVLIENGVLKMHIHDCYTAKRTGQKTTGGAGAPFAVNIAAGKEQLANMLKNREDILLVDRFSGNSSAVKGDFSGVAKSSRLYNKGELVGPVTETMIAGNFFDIAKNIIAISRETELKNGAFLSPYILLDGVSVTGG